LSPGDVLGERDKTDIGASRKSVKEKLPNTT
jgi:hypothetical protein